MTKKFNLSCRTCFYLSSFVMVIGMCICVGEGDLFFYLEGRCCAASSSCVGNIFFFNVSFNNLNSTPCF